MVTSMTTLFGDYFLGLQVEWATTYATNPTGTTEMNMTMKSFLRSKLYIYDRASSITAAQLNANDVLIDISGYDVSTDDVADASDGVQPYQLYVAWQNPDSSAAVTYDGVMVKTKAVFKTGYNNDAAKFVFNYINGNQAAEDGNMYDIKPSSTYGN